MQECAIHQEGRRRVVHVESMRHVQITNGGYLARVAEHGGAEMWGQVAT